MNLTRIMRRSSSVRAIAAVTLPCRLLQILASKASTPSLHRPEGPIGDGEVWFSDVGAQNIVKTAAIND